MQESYTSTVVCLLTVHQHSARQQHKDKVQLSQEREGKKKELNAPRKPMATRALLLLRETPPWTLAGAAAAVTLLWLAAWTLEWAWWSPRRLDRALRAQGLKGTRYRFLTGDVTENVRLNREAREKPLPLGCHDIIPRVLPNLHKAVNENGSFYVLSSDHCPASKIHHVRIKLLSENHLLWFLFSPLWSLFVVIFLGYLFRELPSRTSATHIQELMLKFRCLAADYLSVIGFTIMQSACAKQLHCFVLLLN